VSGTADCLALKGMSVRYPNGDWGIREATVAFPRGSATAIVGASGSGKSSLLNGLCGLAPIVDGEVSFDGSSLALHDADAMARWRRTAVGIVFQQGLLLSELDVLTNVALPLRLRGVSKRRATRDAEAVLDQLGLHKVIGKHPDQLSGGQRQRVAVARAVVHRPPLIVADEPTGSLDSENSARTLDLLFTAAGQLGATMLIVTHDPAIAKMCDRSIRVTDGHIESVLPGPIRTVVGSDTA
jgi:putative ABC transport system ATP-binding protein